MIYFKQISLYVGLLTALSLPGAESSMFTISDDRIRSLDISPVLGRGYSIMTNQFHSTCLMVDETTVPSYNYDYFFSDFTSSSDAESSLEGKLSASLSYGPVKAEFSVEASRSSKVSTQTRMIVATMKIERYYSSVREEVSPLSSDAATLLDSEDYVGFFKACGPNYVRSIRRAQEVSAMFKFTSSSREVASQFAASLAVQARGVGVAASVASKSKYKSASSSMQIKIVGFGLGLNQDGSETLVATSLDEYNEVMKFCFNTMTKNEDAHNIGMVYGIEVVPWVHNSSFQVNAKLQDENIEIPLPRSLIPRAIHDVTPGTAWVVADRDDYSCKDPSFVIDKYGYCCEIEAVYDYSTGEYDTDDTQLDDRVCKPIRSLDKSLVKDNMSNNGEFVARLDGAIRYRLTQLGVMEKCISASNAIPLKYQFNYLKSQDSVKYDKAIETQFTLFHLKKAIDPLTDYGMVRQMANELDEWIEMYYSPCYAALYGMNVGTTPDTDVSYFMAYPWHSHDECMKLSCLSNNLRWDRKDGGCIPGLITGSSAAPYDNASDETECAKDGESNGGSDEVCKHDPKPFHDGVVACWNQYNDPNADIQLAGTGIDYFITHFCMPQITGESLTDAEGQALITAAGSECVPLP